MSYWSSGIKAEDRWHLSIDTARLSGWISLRLGELCRVNTEVAAAITQFAGGSTYHVVVPTGNALASQQSIFRENHLKVSTFIRR